MNLYFNKLMSLEGYDELKSHISVIEEMRCKVGHNDLSKLLPYMIWASKSSEQFSSLLPLLCGYFEESGIIKFVGDVPYIFLAPSHEKSNVATECNKINDILTLAAGFRYRFQGVICVYATEWINHFNDDFKRIVRHIEEQAQNCLIIFIVNTSNEKHIRSLETSLSSCCNIKTIKFDDIAEDKQVAYIKKLLQNAGFIINDQMQHALNLMITQLNERKEISCRRDLEYLVNDLIFYLAEKKFSSINTAAITAYLKKREELMGYKNNSNERPIGFCR